MLMPERKYQASATSSYRYGFNGQENSDEIAAGLTTAMYWEYDSRIGRRWNVDPVLKVWESPYACFSNSPILFNDPSGLTSGGNEDPKPISSKEDALKKVTEFASNKSTASAFPNISKTEIVTRLNEIINNPNVVDQQSTGTCASALTCNMFASYDPVGFVNSTLNLYTTGEDSRNDYNLKVPNKLRGESATALSSVEFLFASAFTSKNNYLLSYNPNKDGSGASSFTYPGNFFESVSKYVGMKHSGMPANTDIAYGLILNDYTNSSVAAVVDTKAFKISSTQTFGASITGDHYLKITNVAEIRNKDATFSYNVSYWCWGMKNPTTVTLNYNELNSAVKQYQIYR